MFVCQACVVLGGGKGWGVLVYFRAAEFRPLSALFLYWEGDVCWGSCLWYCRQWKYHLCVAACECK